MSDIYTLDKTNFKREEIFIPTPESTGDINRYYSDHPEEKANFIGNQFTLPSSCRESYKNLLRANQSTWSSTIGELDTDLLSSSYNFKAIYTEIETELHAFLIDKDFNLKITPNRKYKIKIKIKNITKAKPNVLDVEYFE